MPDSANPFIATESESSIQYKSIELPKYTWRILIGNSVSHGLCINYTDDQVPNWFHRKMQELILGFKWERIDT